MLYPSPIGRKARGAFLYLLFASGHSQADAFLSQDQNPFSLINGQPQPLAADLPTAGSVHWSASLDIANTLNIQTSTQESLYMDFESYLVRFGMVYGLDENWALLLDVPFIDRGGGFLDGPIDSWHSAFGLPQADRPNVSDDRYRISYAINGSTEFDDRGSAQGVGDIQIGIGRSLLRKETGNAGLWLIADLPTGNRDRLTGNEALDISVLLTNDFIFSPSWKADTNLGILFPGNNQFGALKAEDSVLFGHAGVNWSPYTSFDIRLQLNGHSQHYEDSSLKLLGSAYHLIFGATIHTGNCSDLDLAVSEDIMVGATPDVSFLISWRTYSGNCD